MCDPKKIHVFLGAPPPPPPPSSDTQPGQESDGLPESGLRHLELTWKRGRLRPLTETPRGRDKKLQTSCSTNAEKERSIGDDPGSDPDEEDQGSASVLQYLDSCFPAAQPQPEPGPSHCCEAKSLASVVPLCTDNDYLATWTLSQALVLRGSQSTSSSVKNPSTQKPPGPVQSLSPTSSSTPELFSPVTPSPEASVELFSPICSTDIVEEGGVLLQTTGKGVLYSQEAEPETARSLKRARTSEDVATESRRDKVRSVGLHTATTTLVRCQKPNVKYSVLVVAVHPCHLKEVKMKSRKTFVPLASLVVTDQSDVEVKVVLWRRAAFWAVTVAPGDVLLITDLQVMEDRWRGETVLQSTFSSKMLSLGHVAASAQPTAPQSVDAQSVNAFCASLRERRPLLASLPPPVPQDLKRIPYASLSSLRANMLVNILLRVKHAHLSSEWREEAESRCRSARHSKVVLTVEQADGQQGVLLLWGASSDWLPRFTKDSGGVWDFRVLLVRDSLSSDCLELHSTPWSSSRRLQSTDRRLQSFLSPRRSLTGDATVELDVDTLLSQQYSGFVELRVRAMSFRFQNTPSHSQNAPVQLLDSSTTLEGILELLSEDVTYAGCGRCAAELRTDANSIYIPCYPCLPQTSVRRYYRSAVLTVSGQGGTQLCVQVPPIALQEVLQAPPDELQRSSAPGSLVKHIQVAAERLQALLSLPKKTVVITVRSNFLCDENSIVLSQDFTLLSLQFPS